MPSSDASAGRCKSPSTKSTLQPECLARVSARFAATKVLPSLITPLVICKHFNSRCWRWLSRRITRARNFSAPKLFGSLSATKREEGVTLIFAGGAWSNSTDSVKTLPSNSTDSAGSGATSSPGRRCSFSIRRKASYRRLMIFLLLAPSCFPVCLPGRFFQFIDGAELGCQNLLSFIEQVCIGRDRFGDQVHA